MRSDHPRRACLCVPLGLAVVLGGCVAPAVGALMQVMPGAAKTFTPAQDDQTMCQQAAQQAASGQADPGMLHTLGTAAVASVLGPGLGAAIGGGPGAGTGAVAVPRDPGAAQQQYNAAYAQCMSTKGNAVPGAPAAGPAAGPTMAPATGRPQEAAAPGSGGRG